MNNLLDQTNILEHFKLESARVLIVGDVMLDSYWQGDVSRISPEAPVPVLKVESKHHRLGGAANVAWNVASLGAQAYLVGIIGQDEAGKSIESLLDKHVISNQLLVEPTKTITKLRVLGRNQQLIRCDFEQDYHDYHRQVLERIQALLPEVDVVILSDYAKGTLSNVHQIIDLAKQFNKPVLVDPKSNDFSSYRGAYLVTPNFKEFEQAVGECKDELDIEKGAKELIESCALDNVLVTRGAKGMSLFQKNERPWFIPTQAQEVFDVTGAGDTVIAVLATTLAIGHPLTLCATVANLAAGLVVKQLGTAAVTQAELVRAIQQWQEPHEDLKVMNEDDALIKIKDAKSKGNVIVMTNGCFDILHAGHVTYLKKAKRLGTKLLVAVNDDDSVKRLKGPTRPINALEHRMTLLASLECVDWVVPFSQDTPKRIIETLLPDVLVKGGDYQEHEVVGGEVVKAHGGQVVIVDLVPGLSTTKTVNQIYQIQEAVE